MTRQNFIQAKTTCDRGIPTTEGILTLGCSSIENPALQYPLPASIITADANDNAFFYRKS